MWGGTQKKNHGLSIPVETGSALYMTRSRYGGENWKKLGEDEGLPKGI